MKKLLCLLMCFTLVFSALPVNAANHTLNGLEKVPTFMELKDFKRLLEVASEVQKCEVVLTNAQQLNDTTWAVRLQYTRDHDTTADYIVTTIPYLWDQASNKPISLPFNNVEEGNEKYGHNWYYFGLFNSVDHNICGFGLAQRIKRWPSWTDLDFSGYTKDGTYWQGSYAQPCNLNFFTIE